MTNLMITFFVIALVLVTFSSFAQKKAIEVQTTQEIDAPIHEVYDILRSFERFPEWSPFVVTE